MLLFIIGLGLPKFTGLEVNPWTAAGLALTLYASAYLAEVAPRAIAAIPAGQWEAGRALGLNFLRTLRLVIVPQAVRGALAPTVGFMVQIIKGTSLAYIIGFHDLMSVGKRWANASVPGTEAFDLSAARAVLLRAVLPAFILFTLARRPADQQPAHRRLPDNSPPRNEVTEQ